ncbi:MAG: class II aldolase/adducin family protein [Leptolyngbya sp. SIO1D8]|nr:class II aldolase/adducin family protein [Leptolyngbya sp. SIO1D8]
MHEDGVIKYRCVWESGAPFTHQQLISLMIWRDRLHEAGLIGVYADGIGFGNISQRLTPTSFLISGTQTGQYPTTTSAHYTLVDQWDIRQNTLHCMGPLKASSESLTHAALYEYSADIQAIVHVHHQGLWTTYRDVLPTTHANVPYGTPAMADEMWRLFRESNLSDQKILVMAGHQDGLIAFGKTLEAAAANLLTLLASEKGHDSLSDNERQLA